MHCAPGEKFITECVLPADQSKTLTGRWAKIPIPLALQAGAFTQPEIAALQRAVRSWNQFGTASFGKPLFDLQEGTTVRTTTAPRSNFSACAAPGFVNESGYTAPIPIYRLTAGQWPPEAPSSSSGASGGGSSPIIAQTKQCLIDAEKIYFQVVMSLNFQDYFVAGKPVPDLESIFSHELGHTLGLKHSCEESSTPGVGGPSCSGNIPQSYLKAVLFPGYSRNPATGAFETRRALNSNDQGRTNCLYGSN